MNPMAAKRTYNRRSEQELIAAMEAKIAELRKKIESRTRTDQEVLQEVPKIQRRLRSFAQLAMKNGRSDIANSTMAFMAGLERMKDEDPPPRQRGDGH
jgi:molecular chaperone GrpE (heat shock protein)